MSDHERDGSEELSRDLARRLEERDERSARAHAAAAELMGLSAAERPAFAGGHPDCLTPEFIELMIAMARERRGPAPEESVTFAHLAATAAEAAHAAGADDVDDARALAFAELGNAHRICGDLRRAGIAFNLARERRRFAADPLVRAEVDSLEASYLDYRNDFDAAERLLLRAERIYARLGSSQDRGKIRLQRGGVAMGRGETDLAISLLRSGLDLVRIDDAPRLALVAVHNLATCLVDSGDSDSALGLLRRHRAAYELFGSDADRAMLGWIEGRAARTAGVLGFAEASLDEARERFVELKRPYETALVLLELAELRAVQGRWADLEAAATTTLALCRSCGIHAEGVAAAVLLSQAAQKRQEAAESVAGLAAAVRKHLLARI